VYYDPQKFTLTGVILLTRTLDDFRDAPLYPPVAYRVDGVAQVASVSIGTVNNWLREGLLPARKAGGTTLILRAELLETLSNLPRAEFQAPARKSAT
jgi:hypothetical protein